METRIIYLNNLIHDLKTWFTDNGFLLLEYPQILCTLNLETLILKISHDAQLLNDWCLTQKISKFSVISWREQITFDKMMRPGLY